MGYYFISVGDSGTRVLESLAHLCAAGLLPNKDKEGHLYTMSIDPDTGNLTRTNALLGCLDKSQKVKVGKGTPFLKTPLKLATPSVNWSPISPGTKLDDIVSHAHFAQWH